MSYRYTDTNKWKDGWFCSLKPEEKLLFNFLCDNCDIAGFIEYTPAIWAISIGYPQDKIIGALKGLERGLLWGICGDIFYIRNYLKHQKNTPLNENNPAHKGIFKIFANYSHKFDNELFEKIYEAALKGLSSPIGNGNGKVLERGVGKTKIKSAVFDFYSDLEKCVLTEGDKAVFLNLCRQAEDFKRVQALEEPLTAFGLWELIEKSNKTIVFDVLAAMENSADLKKKYKSAKLTANNWIKRRMGNVR